MPKEHCPNATARGFACLLTAQLSQTDLGHAASETSNYPSNPSIALLSGKIPRNKYHSILIIHTTKPGAHLW